MPGTTLQLHVRSTDTVKVSLSQPTAALPHTIVINVDGAYDYSHIDLFFSHVDQLMKFFEQVSRLQEALMELRAEQAAKKATADVMKKVNDLL